MQAPETNFSMCSPVTEGQALLTRDCSSPRTLYPQEAASTTAVGSNKKRTRLTFTDDLYALMHWAASDLSTIEFLTGSRPDEIRKLTVTALVKHALQAAGCRKVQTDSFERSVDPKYNLYERIRARLTADQAKVNLSAKAQMEQAAKCINDLSSRLHAAEQENKAALLLSKQQSDLLSAAEESRSSAADRGRLQLAEAETRAVALEKRAREAEKRISKMVSSTVSLQARLEDMLAAPVDRALQENSRKLHTELLRAQEELRAVQGKQVSMGMELSRMKNHYASQQVQKPRAGSYRQLGCELAAAVAAQNAAEQRTEACVAELVDVREQLAQSRSAIASTEDSSDAGVRVRKLHAGANMPYDPEIAELILRFVSETKISKQNVGAALALAYLIHTGKVPTSPHTVPDHLVTSAFEKLGALDMEQRAAQNKQRKHGVAIAGDTGSRKHAAQYKGAMEVRDGYVYLEITNNLQPYCS